VDKSSCTPPAQLFGYDLFYTKTPFGVDNNTMRCYTTFVKLLLHLAENDEKTNKQYKEECKWTANMSITKLPARCISGDFVRTQKAVCHIGARFSQHVMTQQNMAATRCGIAGAARLSLKKRGRKQNRVVHEISTHV
jgi:hypothetical protein